MSSTSFERDKPLFESGNSRCQYVRCDGRSSMCNNLARCDKETRTYTLRLLEGRRPSQNTYGDERVIRFEVSDECNHVDYKFSHQSITEERDKVAIADQETYCISKNVSVNTEGTYRARINSDQDFIGTKTRISDNPIHIYEFEVGESDFGALRQDQSLLVDFNEFINSFAALLRVCAAHEETSKSVKKEEGPFMSQGFGHVPGVGTSHYTCRIEECQPNAITKAGCVRFMIIESNQFRELAQLSLVLNSGSDSSIRSYLSVRLGQIIAKNQSLEKSLSLIEGRSRFLQDQNENLKAALKQLETSFETDKRETLSATVKQAQAELEKQAKTYTEALNSKEKEVRLICLEFDEKLSSMVSKCANLEGDKESLKSKLGKMEQESQKFLDQLEEKKKSMETVSSELKIAQSKGASLEREKLCLEESLKQLETELNIVKNENETHRKSVEKTNEVAKASSSAEKKAAECLEIHKRQLETANAQISGLLAEMSKARDLVTKLNDDRKDLKQNLKMKNSVVKQQEKSRSILEDELKKSNERLREFESKAMAEINIKEDFESELFCVRSKLSESTKLLESNQRVSYSLQFINLVCAFGD